MLIRMDISNFALIDQAVFEPGNGFTIITGETGAGKSLLIDAISALRGNRTGKDAVRSGCKKATIDAIFDQISDLYSADELAASGIEPESDDSLILSREITSDGKSVARINGKLVPLSVLRDFGSRLVDIHGQNDQQVIFIPAMHLELLDRFGNASLRDVIALYTESLSLYKICIEEIRKIGSDPAARKRRADLLSYQISELEEANFKIGEEEELLKQKRILSSYEKIREGLATCRQVLGTEDEHSAMSQLSRSQAILDGMAHLDSKLSDVCEQYRSALLVLISVEEDLSSYASLSELPSLSLSETEARLDLLFRYKAKYGASIDVMSDYLNQAKIELDEIQSGEKRLEELHRTRLSLEKVLMDRADDVHRSRMAVATELSANIMKELSDLGMPGATFSVAFSQRPKDRFFSRTGYDDVAFMMSANKGEPEKPLARIASGGEASRIMLAIKTILASADETPTLIFDEIDAGISGMTATVVSQKLRMLSQTHQVLCVTHMAQIAAAADQHFSILKQVEDDRTHTRIVLLSALEREAEVARLLSGEQTDHKSLDLAKQLIDRKSSVFVEADS
jgi:DNA repair protein RecN (Recombination protein N)